METVIIGICIILIIISLALGTFGTVEGDESALVVAWVLAIICFLGSMVVRDVKDIEKALIKDRKMEYRSNVYGDTQLYLLDSTMTNTFKEVLDD